MRRGSTFQKCLKPIRKGRVRLLIFVWDIDIPKRVKGAFSINKKAKIAENNVK
jgi:hypothetical protein